MATGEITVNATAAHVMDVLADLPGMLEWSAADSVAVIERDPVGRPTLARWRERYGPLSDEFVLEYFWNGDESASWRLVEGRILKKEDGCCSLTVAGDGRTKVAYSLELGIGLWIWSGIRSRVESLIVTSTLTALKRRVELG